MFNFSQKNLSLEAINRGQRANVLCYEYIMTKGRYKTILPCDG